MSDVPQPNPADSGSPGERPAAAARAGMPFGVTRLLVHWGLFLGVLGVLVGLGQWKPALVNVHFARATARLMGWVMALFGEQSSVSGIVVGTSICRFRIIGECTAYYPIAIYIAAVLAFPAPWLRRLLGVVAGVPVMLVINQVRLVSLCYINRSFPEQFETLHIVVWQSLIIFFTVLLWMLWATMFARRS